MSSPDGGSSPKDDLYSLECQRRLRKLDEPQRQVPSEDLVSWTATWEDESSAQTAGSSGQRRTAPPNWAWFLPSFFSSFCHRWSFGSLPLSTLACLGLLISCDIIDLISQILLELNRAGWWHHWIQRWTAINWKLSVYYCPFALPTHYFPIWYCKAALTNYVLLKALYKYSYTWLDWLATSVFWHCGQELFSNIAYCIFNLIVISWCIMHNIK